MTIMRRTVSFSRGQTRVLATGREPRADRWRRFGTILIGLSIASTTASLMPPAASRATGLEAEPAAGSRAPTESGTSRNLDREAGLEKSTSGSEGTPGEDSLISGDGSQGVDPTEASELDGDERKDSAEPDRQVAAELDSLVSEFLATSDAIEGRPDGKRTVVFTKSEGRPDWYQALVVTNKQNPLLEEECKKEALGLSVETLREAHGIADGAAALEKAATHMREHQDFAASHAISYADYLHEIASCRAFCAPLVAHLVRCQVLAVSHSPHGLVLFDMDNDEVDSRYQSGLIEEASRTLREDRDSRILLIGRASKIGDLRYNRRLSARRALSVRDELIERGAPADRIKTMWFGWEPPQISSWVASRYGFDSIYAREGGHRINQSVVLVIHSSPARADTEEEKEDERVAHSSDEDEWVSTAQASTP